MVLTCVVCNNKFSKLWKNIDFERAERGSFCSRKCYLEKFKVEPTGELVICSKCGDSKDTSLFMKRYSGNRRGKISSWCKSCFSENQMVQWQATKIEIIHLLGNKCSECKGSFHPAAYDLHHLDPDTKQFEWAELRKKPKSIMMNEVSKCVLICGNCHRLEHINEETWSKAKEVFKERNRRDSNSRSFYTLPGSNRTP